MNSPDTTSLFGHARGRSQPRPVSMQTCGEALVRLLEQYGVDLVFGIPGVHTVELYRGLAGSSLRHVTPRHEQGAGFMADGYARVTGKPGVCFVITGPGMTNIATAMAQAYADSIPMLVISSVNATRQLGSGAGRLHELPSQRGVFAGLTAFSHTLLNADELPQVLARAFAVFASERPRPVHIEIPLDVIVAPATAMTSSSVVLPAKPAGAPAALDATAALLASARRPLILAGGGAIEAAAELCSLAERLQAPVALTINAKGLLPRGHALSIGSTQSLAATRALVREADVVLAVGTELGETDYDVVFDDGFAIDGKLVRIDIDPQQVMRNFRPDVAIVADAKLALTALDSRLATRPLPPRDAGWGAPRVRTVRAAVNAGYDAPIRSQAVLLDTISDTLPEVVIVGDSTRPVYAGNFVYEAAAPRSWFNSSTGYGTLGYGLPAAIGARLASGNRAVICLIGDGGLQFTLPELASAVEAAVPVIVLLWNNRGYAEIRKYMIERDIEPIGVDIGTPNFLALARGFGCCAASADTPAVLANELRQAAGRRVPTLIEIDEQKWFDHVSGGPA
ncbi:acetolactate synthase-1/2/3 large subunit [Paraburkholderia sp. GAS448]|uniref:5-guanidino-2-oxopentanoate decarboxylase n=1 Tax=Paraburkholderia sp. GAS448 TaxID=3035136 RepID=UPI003D26082E